jgi:hypothetical protein
MSISLNFELLCREEDSAIDVFWCFSVQFNVNLITLELGLILKAEQNCIAGKPGSG